jgi:hypothetical protein
MPFSLIRIRNLRFTDLLHEFICVGFWQIAKEV